MATSKRALLKKTPVIGTTGRIPSTLKNKERHFKSSLRSKRKSRRPMVQRKRRRRARKRRREAPPAQKLST
jgi:hypothetical protein